VEDWYQTFKHCVLFLFFGGIGGRTALSRSILLIGAPGIIVCQARFMKSYLRQVIYALLYYPPAIVLSLFPAPQQAIVSLNVHTAMATLYEPHIVMNNSVMELLEDENDTLDHLSTTSTSTTNHVNGDGDVEELDSDDNLDDDDDDDDNE
jgi:hypothetical protein